MHSMQNTFGVSVALALRAAAESVHSLIGAMLFGLRVHPLFKIYPKKCHAELSLPWVYRREASYLRKFNPESPI
jgi:hypothetical protein